MSPCRAGRWRFGFACRSTTRQAAAQKFDHEAALGRRCQVMTFCDPLVFTYDHYGLLFPETDRNAAAKLDAIRTSGLGATAVVGS